MAQAASLRRFAVVFVVCGAALWAGGALTRPELAVWYRGLEKPAFTPPDITFAIVWPVLFVMMAIAWWRAVEAAGGFDLRRGREATLAFGLQLALNVLWSALFFAAHQLMWALLDVVLLVLAVAACVRVFRRVDRLAALLMLPYLAWVCFALVLNFRILQLN